MATERSIDTSFNGYAGSDMVLGAPQEVPKTYYTEQSINIDEKMERSGRRQTQGKKVKTLVGDLKADSM